ISQAIAVEVQAAPRLMVTAKVAPTSLKPNGMAKYSVTVTNTGTAIAGNVDILITLPPVVTFLNSVTPFEGNASRSNPIDPVKGSVEVFYGGFNIPPASSAGPGIITVAFMVQVVARPPAGAYPLT